MIETWRLFKYCFQSLVVLAGMRERLVPNGENTERFPDPKGVSATSQGYMLVVCTLFLSMYNYVHTYSNLKPMIMGKGKRKPRETEYKTIGVNDTLRRNNLLANADMGVGKATEKDGNVILRCGTESYGYVIYTIINAKLSKDE